MALENTPSSAPVTEAKKSTAEALRSLETEIPTPKFAEYVKAQQYTPVPSSDPEVRIAMRGTTLPKLVNVAANETAQVQDIALQICDPEGVIRIVSQEITAKTETSYTYRSSTMYTISVNYITQTGISRSKIIAINDESTQDKGTGARIAGNIVVRNVSVFTK